MYLVTSKPEEGWFGQSKYCFQIQYNTIQYNTLYQPCADFRLLILYSFTSLADQLPCGIQRTSNQDLRSRVLQYFKFISKAMWKLFNFGSSYCITTSIQLWFIHSSRIKFREMYFETDVDCKIVRIFAILTNACGTQTKGLERV